MLSAASLAPAAEVHLANLPELFAAACLDGQATLPAGEAAKVGFDQLPTELKRSLGTPVSSDVWRLAGGAQSYLYILKYPDARGTSPQICGVASDQISLDAGAAVLDARLGGAPTRQRSRTMQWIMPKDGYTATATTVSKFDVLQVNWLSSADRKLELDQTSSLPR